jgi:pyruvate dehydrogenase E2 component (dihydrolipoamide acetyltransferase)
MATEFRLPELGENIEAGDVLKVLVAVGDVIRPDQPVLELETDKATIEVPSPVGGTVKSVHVKDGQKLKVGGLILTIDEGAAASVAIKEPPAWEAKAKTESKPEAKAPVAVEERKNEKTKAATKPVEHATTVPPPSRAPLPEVRPAPPAPPEPELPCVAAPASPSVRRLARELGVNIDEVQGSGPDGRISEDDVKAYVKMVMMRPAAPPPGVPPAALPLPDFSRWGEIERQPMKSVRRKTAQHLAHAWSTIPHVTQYDKADITELEQLRKKYEAEAEAAGGKLAMTAIAVKVIAAALKVFPQFASSIDLAREELVYKKYVHIGVAVDTDRGLIVPVIRDADRKNILQLSVELARLAEKARNRKTTLEDMEGGVFTISNLGGIGGTAFSPIVNWPEVAILGIARGRTEPVFMHGLFQPRLMLPLSLSYDHRVIDGADAARFLRWVVQALEQPFLLPWEG